MSIFLYNKIMPKGKTKETDKPISNVMKQKSNQKIMKMCEVSPLYSKDDDDTLHFYCDYCSEEMAYDEIRECKAEREKCPRCGRELGTSDYLLGVCLDCEYKLSE